MIRFCANPACTNLIPELILRENPNRVYCSQECQWSDPAVHDRLRSLNAAQWEQDREGVVERLHTPQAAKKRGEKIAESDRQKPRRQRKPKQNNPGPGD